MNPSVKVSITGLPGVLANLNKLKPAKVNVIARQALSKAARVEVSAVKVQLQPGEFGYDTGSLKKATGFKVKTARDGHSYAVIGARREAKKDRATGTKSPTKWGARLIKKGFKGKPTNYAHLIEFGHRIVTGGTVARLTGKQKGKAAVSKKTKRAGEGKVVGNVEGNEFMAKAFRATQSQLVEIVRADMAAKIKALIAKGK